MTLNDPFFTKFDGSPDLGRVPVRLIVNGSSGLTPNQMLGVEHVYHQFRSTCRLSVSDFHTDRVRLNDGTVVWLWSLQGRDEVTVWPGPDGEEGKLPHGFAVATNWQGPLIYCRDLNDGVQWLLGPPAPQISGHTASHYDNQAFRKDVEANEFFNLPHVRDHWDTVLWDYKMNGAPTVDATPAVPFLLKNTTTGVFSFESPHYAAGGELLDANGAVLYTMADEAPILVPEHPDYPESVGHRPGVTDAEGNQVALQAWRFTVISPMFNIWKFRLWNERINRSDDAAYAVVERAAYEYITPWNKQTTTISSVTDSLLGEDPGLRLVYRNTEGRIPGAVGGGGFPAGGSGSYMQWRSGWAGTAAWLNISGVVLNLNNVVAKRKIVSQGTATSTDSKVLVAPLHNSIGYIEIEKQLNYPATIYWRGGEAVKAYSPESLLNLFNMLYGYDPHLQPNYRVTEAHIYRYETNYDVDGAPAVTAKLGWKNLKLYEGVTTGRMSGKEHSNKLTRSGTYAWISDGVTHITKGNPPGLPNNPAYGAYLVANNVLGEYQADHAANSTQPGMNPTIFWEYPHNTRPSNTVGYNLTSRYVIDFDHKGRFYAAIRCEAVCTGASWKEDIAVYKGYMVEDTAPSYTVRIWFECEWNGVFAQQLLVEETASRPPFEIIAISMFNPWYWPFLAYIDRDCKARVPPEPVPDENFMMMFTNLAGHQGVNPNLCCADVRPDITGEDAEKAISKDGVEYSYEEDGVVTPHTKYVTGQLYARTFKLADFYEAFWLLRQLKVDAPQDNIAEDGGPGGTPRPLWFYHPGIKAALDVTRHIEVRDGVIVQWSDDIPTKKSGFPPTPEPHPAPIDRIIKLYRV